ncbi:unnamed protein product [Absidia cylindrospora]
MVVEKEYRRFLPVTISKAYRTYVNTQRTSLVNGKEETWEMVKGWLMQFTNTPKQVIKNITTYLNMAPADGESGDDFFFRLQQTTADIELTKISVGTLSFLTILRNLDGAWRHGVMEAIRDTNYNILDKDFKDMCVFASDLDYAGKNRHRNYSCRIRH